LVGPRGKHDAGRQSYRHGQEPAPADARRPTGVGDKAVRESRPADASRLDGMLAGLSARRYGKGLEPVGVPPMATARSSISRRFVAGTKRKLAELFKRDLSKLDILVTQILRASWTQGRGDEPARRLSIVAHFD
jgi:putative transposase